MVTVSDYIKEKYGIGCRVVTSTVTIPAGVSQVQILKTNPQRFNVLFQNMSASDVYLSTDKGVSDTYGIVVYSQGGKLSYNAFDDLTTASENWYAYAPANDTTIYISELIALDGVS